MFEKKSAGKLLTLLLAVAVLFTLVCFVACDGNVGEETTIPEVETTVPTTEAPVFNPLTGEAGYSKELVNNRPVAIMINNITQARPQWGLTSPDMVFETLAEGGISRMMWLYADASRIPEKVGSIRSARHYYIQFAQGLDAIFIHFGGSPLAYESINRGDIDNIDGIYSSAYFARDKTRNVASEHTAYSTGDFIRQGIADKGFRTEIKSEYKNPFKFTTGKASLPGGSCNEIYFSFSPDYSYTYKYNEADGLYYSFLGDKQFVDSEGRQQSFTNAVILYAGMSRIDEKRITLAYEQGGSGVYVSNGTYENVTWIKSGSTALLKIYDSTGAEISLNPGRSYIGIVPSDRQSNTVITGAAPAAVN